MKVTNENIEELIVDYVDGNLSKEVAAEVDRFVAQHPEYADLLNDYSEACGITDDAVCSESLNDDIKDNMKHTSDFDEMDVPYFDRLAVLVTENIAQPSESAEFEKMLLENDANIKSAALYSKTKVQINNDIEFPSKQQLKHTTTVRKIWYYAAAAVAVILLLLMIKPLINSDIMIDSMAMHNGYDVKSKPVAAANESQLSENQNDSQSINNQTESQQITSPITSQPINSPISSQNNSNQIASLNDDYLDENQYFITTNKFITDSIDIARIAKEYNVVNVETDSMRYVSIDYAEEDPFIDDDNFSFIGERGVVEARRLAGLFHRRNKERNNPKICFSYDDDGKKDGMSLLIGGREVRVWSR